MRMAAMTSRRSDRDRRPARDGQDRLVLDLRRMRDEAPAASATTACASADVAGASSDSSGRGRPSSRAAAQLGDAAAERVELSVVGFDGVVGHDASFRETARRLPG